MSERLPETHFTEVHGESVLEFIKELNQKNRFAVLAPNHLVPQSKLRKFLRAADDFSVLKSVLDEHDVSATPVVKGDTNIAFGETNGVISHIKQAAYEFHRKIFSRLMKMGTGGITVNINYKEPDNNVHTNITAVRRMIETLTQKDNLLIYPYGNWFESGEQQFDPKSELDNGTAFVNKQKDFERWRTSLKDTFIRLAQRAKAPIVPIYVTHENSWSVRFGNPIDSNSGEKIEIAKKYLESMRKLKEDSAA